MKQQISQKDRYSARPKSEQADKRAVVHVVPRYPPALGGTENAAQAIAQHQHKAGIRVQVLTSDQGASDSAYEEKDFPVARLRGFNLANTPIMPSLLFRLLALDKKSIIHVHIAQAYTPDLVWLCSRLRRVQYVAHFHADVIPTGRAGALLKPYKKILLRRVLRDASKVLVPTDDYRDLVCSNYDIQPNRVAVVHNGTDHRTVSEPRSIVKQGETARLLFVGRLAVQKNVPLLLRAVAAYRNKYNSNFHLTIAGDGDMRPAIEAEIHRLGLDAVVSLIGVRHGEELESIYETSDLLILTSIFESFGLVLIEAMAKALPIVSVHIPAVRNVVVDGVNGLLVESEPDALANAIHTFLTDKDFYTKVSMNNLAAVRRYTWTSVVDKISTVYESL